MGLDDPRTRSNFVIFLAAFLGVKVISRSLCKLARVWENYKLYLSRNASLAQWHRNVPSYFTFDDHELVNDIWGAATAGKRHRRTVFRDIGTYAWFNYLGWANPTVHKERVHFGRAKMEAGSDLLVDPSADFNRVPLDKMLNLHVHWDTEQAGVNDMKFDNDDGHKNSYVYDIVKVVDKHTLLLHMPAKVTDEVSYSIGRRSYASFRVANCEYFLLDTRGDRDMHDVTERDKKGHLDVGRPATRLVAEINERKRCRFLFRNFDRPFHDPSQRGWWI